MASGGLWLLSLSSVIVVMAPPHFGSCLSTQIAISPSNISCSVFDTPHELQHCALILTNQIEAPDKKHSICHNGADKVCYLCG